jgi:hypothetical protein
MARQKTFTTAEIRNVFKLDTEGFEEDAVFIPDTAEEVWIVVDEEEDEEIARFQMHLAERRILASL